MSQVFSILTLPRCRSAWLANFLDYPPAVVIHEPSRLKPNWKELRQQMEDGVYQFAGLVDPSVAGFDPDGWLQAFGDCPVGMVLRPPADVVQSLLRFVPSAPKEKIEEVVETCLKNLERIHSALGGEVHFIQSAKLGDPESLRGWLAKLLPGLPFWGGRHQQLARLRVQVVGYTPAELRGF